MGGGSTQIWIGWGCAAHNQYPYLGVIFRTISISRGNFSKIGTHSKRFCHKANQWCYISGDVCTLYDASGFISLPSGFCGSLDMMLQETHVVMRYTHSKKRCPRALATVRLNYLWSSVTKAIDPLANTQRTRHAASWRQATPPFSVWYKI